MTLIGNGRRRDRGPLLRAVRAGYFVRNQGRGARMTYREDREDAQKQQRQRSAALGLALLSGHGAALFLSILTPVQLAGRISVPFLGVMLIIGAIAAATFGFGVAAAWNGLNADGESRLKSAGEYFASSMDIAMKALMAAVMALTLAGLLMFHPGAVAFMFGSSPASAASPEVLPQKP